MKNLDVHKSLASYVTVDITESVAEALTKLRNADSDFIMITQKWGEQVVPVSVLREPALMDMAAQQNQKLQQLLERFSPILTINEGDLDDDYLSDVLTILGETDSAGFVVRLADNSLGILSRASVARALPLEEIVHVGSERGIAGGIGVPARSYVCRQCTPERRKIIRVGGPPDCDVWSHGEMEEE